MAYHSYHSVAYVPENVTFCLRGILQAHLLSNVCQR